MYAPVQALQEVVLNIGSTLWAGVGSIATVRLVGAWMQRGVRPAIAHAGGHEVACADGAGRAANAVAAAVRQPGA